MGIPSYWTGKELTGGWKCSGALDGKFFLLIKGYSTQWAWALGPKGLGESLTSFCSVAHCVIG